MVTVLELPEAPLVVDTGAVEAKSGEKELKRSVAVWGENERVLITLTTKRLLIRSVSGKSTPRHIDLCDVAKAKVPSDGLFGKKKKDNVCKIHIKMADSDTKHEIVFSQPGVSIMNATEERDDFLELMQQHMVDTPASSPAKA